MQFREISEDDQEKIGKLFTTKRGSEVLDILNKVFYNTISYTPGDTHTSAFRDGQRDLVQIFRTLAEVIISQEK